MEIGDTHWTGPIVCGTCETMCPRAELVMRESEGLLYSFEMAFDQSERNKRPLANPERVVKQYSRPAAGRVESDPSDLRPAPVLIQTMNYLLHDIATLAKPAWSEIYAFVFDRSRAVRQDMIIQGITGHDAIYILEQAVRFHSYAAYRLRHAGISEFDSTINKHHLLECLKRLLYLYQVTKVPHENRAEFEAVYLLDNLGDESAIVHFLDLPLELRKQPLLRMAFDISKSFCLRNYLRVLRLIHSLSSCICLCVVSCHLYNLQVNFLQIMSHAFSVKNCHFPVSTLASLLHCASEKDVADLCSECGLIDMFDQDSSDFIQFSKIKFRRPQKEKPISSVHVLDKLLESIPLSEIFQKSKFRWDSSPCHDSSRVEYHLKEGEADSDVLNLGRRLAQTTVHEERTLVQCDRLDVDGVRNRCGDQGESRFTNYSADCHNRNDESRLSSDTKITASSKNESNSTLDFKEQVTGGGKETMAGVLMDSTTVGVGVGRSRGRGRGRGNKKR